MGIVAMITWFTKVSEYSLNLFMTEVLMQSQLRCINVVRLVGYCIDGDKMILVHEFMSNGSLFQCLHYPSNSNPLSWNQRLQICIGVARGLDYLHTGVGHTIVHCDVKSSSILLDENWVAKISDFGQSSIGDRMHVSHVTTVVVGTLGYLDPEYFHTSRITEKSDVYSFGVVLLEVLCARKVLSFEVVEERRNLSTWAIKCIEAGSIEEIIDPYLMGKISPPCLSVFVKIARKCLLLRSNERPSMNDVVRKLELALVLQETASDAALENEELIEVEPTNNSSHELLSLEWHPDSIYHSSSALQDIELSRPR